MPSRGTVVWAPDPFRAESGNPRPWLIVSDTKLPYADEESIAIAFTTQTHHSESVVVPSDAWIRGESNQRSQVLPWTVATLKHELHVAGIQGAITQEFTDRIARRTASYLHTS